MATIIPCANIEAEADRLLQLFRACYTLTGDDMDDLVNLTYSASLCGTGNGSIPTFDQNNIVTIRQTNYTSPLTPDAWTAINAGSAFVVDEKEIMIFKHYVLDQNSTYETPYKVQWYLLTVGKGTYGTAGTALTSSSLFLLKEELLLTLPNTPGTTQPPRVLYLFADQVGGATTSTPHTILNADAATIPIVSTQDTYFAVHAETGDIPDPSWKMYRWIGADGSYGAGVDTAILGDFVLVESYDGLASTSLDNDSIRWRNIAPPSIVDTARTSHTTVSEAVNNGFLYDIDCNDNEILSFQINRMIGTADAQVQTFATEIWVWNQGTQANVNTGSVDSDFTKIETLGTILVDATGYSNPTATFHAEYATYATVADAVLAVNALTGTDRVVLLDNLVLVKVQEDTGGTDYSIWEFTGGVGGNGTYGVAGLTAVAGDFNVTEFATSATIAADDGPITAEDIYYEDNVTALGSYNVQGAIEALDALVIAASPGSSWYDAGGVVDNYDATTDAYRTGKTGLGLATAPTELFEVTGTEAGATTGIKAQYTWSSGGISRFQTGGQNQYSEVGLTPGDVEGFNHEYFANTTDYVDNIRAIVRGGNYAAADSLGKTLSATIGVQSLADDRHAVFSAIPLVSNDDVDWQAIIHVLNEFNDTASVSVTSKGTGAGYNLEAISQIGVTNGVESTAFGMTPHYGEFDNLFKFTGYGVGTFIQGYAHTDDVANTGTAATTIGVPTYLMAVDASGVIMDYPIPAASGDVSKVGTPVNNELGVWTGDGTIEGESELTYDGTIFSISEAASNYSLQSTKTYIEFNSSVDNNARIAYPPSVLTNDVYLTIGDEAGSGSGTPYTIATREWVADNQDIKQIKVSLTASHVNNIGTTPQVAILKVGSGTVINVISAFAKLTWGSVAFDTNDLHIVTNGAAGNLFTCTSFLDSVADNIKRFDAVAASDIELAEDTTIYLDGTDSVATGDSTVDVYITYEVITL